MARATAPKPVVTQPGEEAPRTRPWYVEDLGHGANRVRTQLHPGQWAVMRSQARHTAMIAGTQGGKTSLGPIWLEREIRLRGPGDYLAVTATYPLLKRKMLPEFLTYFRDVMGLGTWAAGDKIFTFHDGQTRIMFGSASNPESLESATAKAAWLDECGQNQFRIESWEAIQRRLSIEQGRTLMTTTPYNRGWLKTEVYDKARQASPQFRVVQFASTLNPRFPQAELDAIRESGMPSWKIKMFYEGLFDNPPGLIYGVFNDTYREQGGHLVRPFAIPPFWPRLLGLDFGGSNTAKLYMAYDELQDTYYIYRVELGGGLTAAQHVEEVKRELGGAYLRAVYGGGKSEQAWRDEFTAAGLMVQDPPEGVYDVEVGIDRGVGLFTNRRCFVFDNQRGLIDELGTYSRPVDPDGTVLPGIVDKNKFHRLDAFRAVALGIGGPPEPTPVISLAGARGWLPGTIR